MVRFINKNLKAHTYDKGEEILEILDTNAFNELTTLLTLHVRNFVDYYTEKGIHLLQKLTLQLGITRPTEFNFILSSQRTTIKDLFLTLEIILESFHSLYATHPDYPLDFVSDINELFLIHKIPLQITYFPNKNEFYVEKIISPGVSEKIKETLEIFSKENKVFEDFKEAIKKYSSGDYEGSIEKCCVSIEDYLCILLNKATCQSIDSYYNDASKILKIPEDLNDRFSNIIKYIHRYRSQPNHGAIEKKEIPEPELTTQIIIQFTMTILYYLKKKKG